MKRTLNKLIKKIPEMKDLDITIENSNNCRCRINLESGHMEIILEKSFKRLLERSKLSFDVIRDMIRARVSIEPTYEVLIQFAILHEYGHYLDFKKMALTEVETYIDTQKADFAFLCETLEEDAETEQIINIAYREMPMEVAADNYAISELIKIYKRRASHE